MDRLVAFVVACRLNQLDPGDPGDHEKGRQSFVEKLDMFDSVSKLIN